MSAPTGVAATAATAATATTPPDSPRPEEYCLQNLREYLLAVPSSPSAPAPVATCPVCYAELAAKGIPASSPSGADDRKDAGYLPCGHMFCVNCLVEVMVARQTDGTAASWADITCPVCRANPAAPRCGHPAARRVPTDQDTWSILHCPATVPEGGVPTEACCRTCLVLELIRLEFQAQRTDWWW